MSDFLLTIDRDGRGLRYDASAFRPSGTFTTASWEVVWIASCRNNEPTDTFFDGWEDQTIASLDGRFAVVAVHKRDDHIIVARDIFGLVPIRYTDTHFFTGATLPPGTPYVVDTERLGAFITMQIDHRVHDYFVGVSRVLPGEAIEVRDSRWIHHDLRMREWPARTEEELIEGLRSHLDVAIPESDAYTLSGGFDSGALASLASRDGRVRRAWTIRYPEARTDETAEAKSIARDLGIPLSIFDGADSPAMRDLDYFVDERWWGFGPSFMPTAWTEATFFKHIADHTTGEIVVGAGGDHLLFSNYDVALREAWYQRDWRAVVGAIRHHPIRGSRQLITTNLRALGWSPTPSPSPPTWWTSPLANGPSQDRTWSELKERSMRTWRWESATRLMEHHARAANRPLSTPWLSVPLWNLMYSATPGQLRLGNRPKGIAREALKGVMPENDRLAPKRKGPNKFVEFGLGIDRRDVLDALWVDSQLGQQLPNFIPTAFQTAFRRWADDVRLHYPDGLDLPTVPIWAPIGAELWLGGERLTR